MHTAEVDGHDGVEGVGRGVVDRRARGDPGAGDDDVRPPEGVLAGVDQPGRLLGAGHVDRVRAGAAACAGDRAHQLAHVARLVGMVGKQHRGALPRQAQRDRRADAGRGTGHDGGPPAEVERLVHCSTSPPDRLSVAPL